MPKLTLVFSLLGIAVLAAVPLFPQVVYPVFVMKLLCMVLFACAYNLLLGFAGIMSFGHAAFLGTAAYLTGYCMKAFGLSTEVGILAGTLSATALGVVFGALAIRRQGIYLSMITLALAQMMYFIFLQAKFTGAEDGMQQVPRGYLFGLIDLRDDTSLYYLVLTTVGGGLWLIWRTIHSPFGEVLRAIREHEPRAISLGYKVQKFKLLAFTLSAGLSGLAGSLKTLVFQLAALTDVHWQTSGDVVLMTLLGGMHTVFGPAIGAFIITALQYYLDAFGQWVTVVVGAIFIACVSVFRQGVAGTLNKIRRSDMIRTRDVSLNAKSLP
jgi:branched-chain amino acid transport system permease protein